MKKFLSVFMVTMLVLSTSVVFAAITDGGSFTPGDAANIVGKGLSILKWVAYAGCAIMLTFAGIKYIMAGADEKAAAKESLMPILLGAVLIFAATSVAGFMFGF